MSSQRLEEKVCRLTQKFRNSRKGVEERAVICYYQSGNRWITLVILGLFPAQKGEIMLKRRKDSKGRVLRTGESERTDHRYQFRYQDKHGKRRTVYGDDLQELREKEMQISKDMENGIDYSEGLETVYELVERYTILKRAVRYNTKQGYKTVLNRLQKDPFGKRQIRTIRVSDAKLWFIRLQERGAGYSTITSIRGVVKPAFEMAYSEEIIRRNPFDFDLSGVVINDSKKRSALTAEEKDKWLAFVREDKTYSKYYDEYIVLLGTGMRVSEFCGLTIGDIDFEHRKIHVDKQLVRERGGKYYVEKTKTVCGRRDIPMTGEVAESLQNIIAARPKPKREKKIDGYSDFLLLDKDLKPKVALHIENSIRWGLKKYAKLYPNDPLPHITPHVLRHTFCTNMANAGMDIKSLQYVMGHSEVGVTLNIYTHSSFDRAAEQMRLLAAV